MWPYSKIKHTQPELKQAECPKCGAPATGWYQDGELIITRICLNC